MTMKYFYIVVLLCLLIPQIVIAVPTASYDVYYLNTSDHTFWPLTSLNVTKGQVIAFNASATGVTTWAWDYGDGFTGIGRNSTHVYKFGTNGHSLLLTNAWTRVTTTLNASDVSSSAYQSKIINITTAMPDLEWVDASQTIAPLNESYANGFIAAIGGNSSVPQGWIGIDWLLGITWVQNVYVSVLGATLFFIILFSIPFIMQWIISKDFVVAGVMGGIIGAWMINRLPGNMRLLAVTFIAMSIVAIIYSLLKERS